MNKLYHLMALVAAPERGSNRQSGKNGVKLSEIKRLITILAQAKIVNETNPDDPLLPHLASKVIQVLESIYKFGVDPDGGIHFHEEGQEIIVKLLTNFGEVLIPKEIKVKGDIPQKSVKGYIFTGRQYFKIEVVIKYPPQKIGKKFFQPISQRTLLIDESVLKGGPIKIIGQIDQEKK